MLEAEDVEDVGCTVDDMEGGHGSFAIFNSRDGVRAGGTRVQVQVMEIHCAQCRRRKTVETAMVTIGPKCHYPKRRENHLGTWELGA